MHVLTGQLAANKLPAQIVKPGLVAHFRLLAGAVYGLDNLLPGGLRARESPRAFGSHAIDYPAASGHGFAFGGQQPFGLQTMKNRVDASFAELQHVVGRTANGLHGS